MLIIYNFCQFLVILNTIKVKKECLEEDPTQYRRNYKTRCNAIILPRRHLSLRYFHFNFFKYMLIIYNFCQFLVILNTIQVKKRMSWRGF